MSDTELDPGQAAIGTWSGGRFLHFGEAISEERLVGLLRPDRGIRTVITADAYGTGDADRILGKAVQDLPRDRFRVVGAIGHDFYDAERDGPRGFPRFTSTELRGPEGYRDYIRRATERQLARLGTSHLDLLLLHNPDRAGYTSEVVWDALVELRDEGVTGAVGVAPGPANGFTLDLLDCFDRYGEEIAWAMIILNPLEPWPGSLVLEAAEAHGVDLITRVVDYGGLFWGGLKPGHELGETDHRRHRPEGWIEAGTRRIDRLRPIAEEHGLTPMQLACQWNLAHPAVKCVVPTLIQESGPDARPIEAQREELAALPTANRLSPGELARIAEIGDNRGSMHLKGASPDFTGEERADGWPLTPGLVETAARWGIEPGRDLTKA